VKTIEQHCDTAAVLHDGTLVVFDDLKEAFKFYHQSAPGLKEVL
jgi:ABC-type polysaccharide/polyol phosphate transport system ATPase subunit